LALDTQEKVAKAFEGGDGIEDIVKKEALQRSPSFFMADVDRGEQGIFFAIDRERLCPNAQIEGGPILSQNPAFPDIPCEDGVERSAHPASLGSTASFTPLTCMDAVEGFSGAHPAQRPGVLDVEKRNQGIVRVHDLPFPV
jgi:hypothetical protein